MKGEFWRPETKVLNLGTLFELLRVSKTISQTICWGCGSSVFLGFKVHTMVGEGQMVPQNFVQRN